MYAKSRLVYGLLLGVWAVVVIWQVMEHDRVKQTARTALVNRSKDIATTLGVVIRSQRFRSVVLQERLEPALKELAKSDELSSIALLNSTGSVMVSAGPPIDFETKGMSQSTEHWDYKNVTLVHRVDLGTGDAMDGETNRTTVVLPPRTPGPPRDRTRPPDVGATNGLGSLTNTPANEATNLPRSLTNRQATSTTNVDTALVSAPLGTNGTNLSEVSAPLTNRPPPERRPRGRRPFGMSEEEFQVLQETRGLHWLAIAMSTENFRRVCAQDLWMRWFVSCLAGISVAGLGVAWRNIAKSSELQMRLLRASELNSHLKEMNLAAAGLAHETRNPLNIIRGLAQMVSKEDSTVPEVRKKLRDIVDETDRVSAQLNEFINYSRPREVRRAPLALGSVVGEVVRALNFDLEEKQIHLETTGEQLTIEADEQLLRQCLFNLLLNAVQAAEPGGAIKVSATGSGAAGATLEVIDNGPGVAPQHRSEIFKPYFTTHAKGTGLGLAVVQQIVLAHGWEIEYLPNQPRGAIFRITHLKQAGKP